MTTPIAQGPVDVNVSRCTVRVKTGRVLEALEPMPYTNQTWLHRTGDLCGLTQSCAASAASPNQRRVRARGTTEKEHD